MAFVDSNLTQLSTGNGFTLWHYSTPATIATVNSAGYFNTAVKLLGVRDLIIVSDTNTPTMNFCIVLSNDGSAVDISDGTAIAETDGD